MAVLNFFISFACNVSASVLIQHSHLKMRNLVKEDRNSSGFLEECLVPSGSSRRLGAATAVSSIN